MSEYTVYLPEKRYPSDGIGYLSAHASSAQATQLSMGVIHLHAAKEKIKIHSFAHGARQHVNPNSNHDYSRTMIWAASRGRKKYEVGLVGPALHCEEYLVVSITRVSFGNWWVWLRTVDVNIV